MFCQICGAKHGARLSDTGAYVPSELNAPHAISQITLDTYAGTAVYLVVCDRCKATAQNLNHHVALECTNAKELFKIASLIYSSIAGNMLPEDG